ncbi:MAG: CBS domain-containing protein [Candidatus Hadarchaeum sp.]|uniref:CBS domain-containing protein n=1 Tax=Candidatus Hadarchaeum sp. TaxID=2883567 RepID=UPI003D0B2AED
MGVVKPSEVRAMRMRLGFSQSKLAKLAGVTQAYIAKIESGKADPRFSTLERISKVLEQASAPEKQVLVEKIMSAPIVFARPNDKVETVIKTMRAHDISQLPVLDREVQVGSISESSVVQRIATGENMARLLRRNVSEIMDKPFPTVAKEADVNIVYSLLEHAPAILVVDHGRPVGIITKADVFKLAMKT